MESWIQRDLSQVDTPGVPISRVLLAVAISEDSVSTEWSGEKKPSIDNFPFTATGLNDDT